MKKIVENIKAHYKLIGGVLVFGILLGVVIGKSGDRQQGAAGHQHATEMDDHEEQSLQTWTCSMHPQIKQDKPGQCPICGMDLIPLKSSGNTWHDPNEITMSESAAMLASVQTLKVTKGMPQKNIRLQGKVYADERNIAEITARYGGRIEKLFVNFTGMEVKKGQKLATIYSPELLSAQRELLESIKFKETRPSIYHAARTRLKLWDLTDSQINAIEKEGKPRVNNEILSPIAGTVLTRHIALGDYVKEGNPLFRVVNLSKVWVMFDAYESDLPWLKKGDQISFTIQALPGKNYNAKIGYIDPFLNAKTRVAQVRVEVENKDQLLKPEMFANGIVESSAADDGKEILIPKTAILWTGKRAVVYVKIQERENPTFKYREIVLGPEAGAFYVVADGLQEGEVIAVNGVFKIDAAAQLEGKQSMMNPAGESKAPGHDHGEMDMGSMSMSVTDGEVKQEQFKVSGNCEMCKSTIETAAKNLPGVNAAAWDIDSKVIHVSYNTDKNSLSDIHNAIAAAGYDTENEKASEDAYNALPECCLYTREHHK